MRIVTVGQKMTKYVDLVQMTVCINYLLLSKGLRLCVMFLKCMCTTVASETLEVNLMIKIRLYGMLIKNNSLY